MTSFIDVIKRWSLSAPKGELIEIRDYFNEVPLIADLAANTLEVLRSDGLLAAVKFVKAQTGWGLKESKEYVDTLI